MRGLLLFAPPALLLVAALVFGGANRLNPIGLMIAEGLGVLTLAPALLRSPDLAYSRLTLAAIILLALAVALVLLQLTPLPPDLWKSIPGREALAKAVGLAGLPNHWRPMSLAPDETQGAALFLLAPAGMFLGALQCGARERLWLVLAALGVALISLPLGLAQLATGAGGHFQVYAGATAGAPNGFFANHNHQAAFMIAAVGLSAALLGERVLPFALERRPRTLLALILVFAIAAAATLSRAGLFVLGPVLVVALLIIWRHMEGANRWMRLALPVAAAIGVAAMILALKGGALVDRNYDTGAGAFSQAKILPSVTAAGQTLQPLGGGVGAFDLVYRSTESLDQVSAEYLNHVHDDFVELWFEGGWPAVALLAAMVAWWGFGAYTAWFGPSRADAALARSGSLVVAALLIQSAMDYPLRTPAMAVVFALGCALMAPTPRLKLR